VKTDRVAEAMLAVDRGLFSKYNPYADSPQSIGYGATISAPHMVLLLVLCKYSKFRIESNSYNTRFETSTIIRNFRILTVTNFLLF